MRKKQSEPFIIVGTSNTDVGYAATVQVLMDLQILSKEDYEKWRFGKVDYLERVCKVNLTRLRFVLHTMQEYGKKQGLKESFTYYKKWGKKGKDTVKLRFSKSGNENVDKRYATHFVKSKEYKIICREYSHRAIINPDVNIKEIILLIIIIVLRIQIMTLKR